VTTTVMMPSSTELMQAWRRQLGQRARLADRNGPRPFAVVSYRVRGRVIGGHVTLRQLTLVALFDERLESGELATRLVGVTGTIEADGVRFGGPALSRFDKNLWLAPAAGGRGARLDAADAEFLSFSLQLERFLERCARHPYVPRCRVPRFPVVPVGGVPPGDSCRVELASLPKRQVMALDAPRTDLRGRFGSTVFDFYNTRFRVAP
jgi:hypothetical protein